MEIKNLRIAVVHDDLRTLSTLNTALDELGHRMCVSATDGQQFIAQCRSQRPDLLMVKGQLPDMYGVQAAAQASRDNPIPIILIVDQHDEKPIAQRNAENLLAVLAEPVRIAVLIPTISLVMRRFQQLSELRTEKEQLQKVLIDP